MADSHEEERQQEFAEQDNPIAAPTEEEAEIEHKSIVDIDPPSVRAYLTAKYASPAEESFAGYEDTSAIAVPGVPVDPIAQSDPSATVRKSFPKNILSELVQPFRQLPTMRREVTSALPTVRQSRPVRDSWPSDFRIWRLRRPFWGSILMMMASFMMLWGPVSLLRFALLPGSSIWAGIFVGILLFIMALIQLLTPSYAVITGGVGVALSLVSLLVAGFGGLGIGVILGTIGSALGVAWKPNAQPLPTRQR
jgi:uncharacterized protein DUF6114